MSPSPSPCNKYGIYCFQHKQTLDWKSRQQWSPSRYSAMEWRQGSPRDLSSTSPNTGDRINHQAKQHKTWLFCHSKVCSMVEEAKQKGATVVVGGEASSVGELHYQWDISPTPSSIWDILQRQTQQKTSSGPLNFLTSDHLSCTLDSAKSRALEMTKTRPNIRFSVFQANHPDRSHPWDATLPRGDLRPSCLDTEVLWRKGLDPNQYLVIHKKSGGGGHCQRLQNRTSQLLLQWGRSSMLEGG